MPFERFFGALALGDDASIGLYLADGTLIVGVPHDEATIGKSVMSGPVHQRILSKMDHGSTRMPGAADGGDQLASARRLANFPLSVIATSTVSAALSDWRQQMKLLAGSAGLLALVIAGILFLIARHVSRDHREAGQRLAMEKQRLDAALNNMTQGLILLDSTKHMVICNQRYIEMYGLSSEIVKPGCSLERLLAHHKETGSFVVDADDGHAVIMSGIARRSTKSRLIETADGRSIKVISRPLQDGGWVSTHEDITERTRSDERIAHLAHHDVLTDLPNRVLFGISLLRAMTACATAQRDLVLFKLDLDSFQEINDAIGLAAADEVLYAVSQRLNEFAGRHEAYLARTGGDEFALFFSVPRSNDEVGVVAADLCREIALPLLTGDRELTVEACIGVATFPFLSTLDVAVDRGTDVSELMTRAAMALQAAKRVARGTCRLYSSDFDDRKSRPLVLRQALRKAIDDRQFTLHYQPLVDLSSGRIVGAEALIRWDHPTLGLQRPDVFIPLAERSGLIVPLGAWVLHEAMRQTQEWRRKGVHVPKIAINISGAQLLDPDFLGTVERALRENGARAECFELELTEGFMIDALGQGMQHVAHGIQPGPLLVVGLDDNPGTVGGVGVKEHRLLGLGVVVPLVE